MEDLAVGLALAVSHEHAAFGTLLGLVAHDLVDHVDGVIVAVLPFLALVLASQVILAR